MAARGHRDLVGTTNVVTVMPKSEIKKLPAPIAASGCTPVAKAAIRLIEHPEASTAGDIAPAAITTQASNVPATRPLGRIISRLGMARDRPQTPDPARTPPR